MPWAIEKPSKQNPRSSKLERRELIDEANHLNPMEIRVGSTSDTIMVRPRSQEDQQLENDPRMDPKWAPRRRQIGV